MFVKPVQFYFIGDRGLATKYINYAKKHLQLTQKRWEDASLPVLKNVRRLADGAIITVLDYENISIIKIDVTRVGKISGGRWKYFLGLEDQTTNNYSYWMYGFELPDQKIGLKGTEGNIQARTIIAGSYLADTTAIVPPDATGASRYTIPYTWRSGTKSILYSHASYNSPVEYTSIDELWASGNRIRGDQPFYYNDAFDQGNIPFYGYGQMDNFIYQFDTKRVFGRDYRNSSSIEAYLQKVVDAGDVNGVVVANYLYNINASSFSGEKKPSLAASIVLGRDSHDMGTCASVSPDGYLRFGWFKCDSYSTSPNKYSFTTGIHRYDLRAHKKVLDEAEIDEQYDNSRFDSVEFRNLATFVQPTEVERISGNMYSIDAISFMDQDSYENGTTLKVFSLRYEDGWGWGFYTSGHIGQDPIDAANEVYVGAFVIDETDLGIPYNYGIVSQIYVKSNNEMYISIAFDDGDPHLQVFKCTWDQDLSQWVKQRIHSYDVPTNPGEPSNSNGLHVTGMGRYLHVNGYNMSKTLNPSEFYDVAYIYDTVSNVSWNIARHLVDSGGNQIIGEPSENSARQRYQGVMYIEQKEHEI